MAIFLKLIFKRYNFVLDELLIRTFLFLFSFFWGGGGIAIYLTDGQKDTKKGKLRNNTGNERYEMEASKATVKAVALISGGDNKVRGSLQFLQDPNGPFLPLFRLRLFASNYMKF